LLKERGDNRFSSRFGNGWRRLLISMRPRKDIVLAAATFAAVLVAGVFVLPLFGDPTPAARGEPTHVASIEPAPGLRGRAEEAPAPRRLRVIDGDTLEDLAADIIYRIENIDTPETGPRAQCTAERQLGDRATREARALIAAAVNVQMQPTGRIDRYGRSIAFVLIDGRDLGETLIAEGLARPWRGRREPWCDSGGNLIP
jgi:endonuclease YncB( thermonuclease family)